jgi:hypothetical protein
MSGASFADTIHLRNGLKACNPFYGEVALLIKSAIALTRSQDGELRAVGVSGKEILVGDAHFASGQLRNTPLNLSRCS